VEYGKTFNWVQGAGLDCNFTTEEGFIDHLSDGWRPLSAERITHATPLTETDSTHVAAIACFNR
jgi:hypothetical protein